MTFDKEVSLDFDFKFTPAEPATRDYPGDGAEVDITKVRMNGVEIPIAALTTQMVEEMIEQVLDHYT